MSKVKSRHRCISLMNGNWYEIQFTVHTAHDGEWYGWKRRKSKENEAVYFILHHSMNSSNFFFCYFLLVWLKVIMCFFFFFFFASQYLEILLLTSKQREKMKQVNKHWMECRCRFSLSIRKMSPYLFGLIQSAFWWQKQKYSQIYQIIIESKNRRREWDSIKWHFFS